MTDKAIGVVVRGRSVSGVLRSIREAEALGIQAVWLESAVGLLDPLTLFAAAAAQTSRIQLGTGIVPIWSRHPLAVVQQAQVLAELATGRFRLGVGVGTIGPERRAYGSSFHTSLGRLTEYVQVLKAILQTGEVDFLGFHYEAHARLPAPLDIPIMMPTVGRRSFALCGAHADAGITGLCPADYVQDVGIPALITGAEQAGRAAPPVVFNALVCVHDDPQEVKEAVRQRWGRMLSPSFVNMFASAGFPEANEGWSDAMIEAVVVHGVEDRVAERLKDLLHWGPEELMLNIVEAGENRAASAQRTLALVGDVARSLL